MAQELIYTSARRGLFPGQHGFCTVACTPGMPAALRQRLESLTGYRPLFAGPDVDRNPVAFFHLPFTAAGRRLHVLGRVAPAPVDYSGRTNKLAHLVVLGHDETVPAGPAWLLRQKDFFVSSWDGEPRLLTEPRAIPSGDGAVGVCEAWESATGDAGWAAVLADSALRDPDGITHLLFQPGDDPLPLVAEALALLPANRRCEVGFTTYYTTLPPDVDCRWRCVPDGQAVRVSGPRPDGRVIRLFPSQGNAPDSALAHRARNGEKRSKAAPDIRQVTETGAHRDLGRPGRSHRDEEMTPSVRETEDRSDRPRRRKARPAETTAATARAPRLLVFLLGLFAGIALSAVALGLSRLALPGRTTEPEKAEAAHGKAEDQDAQAPPPANDCKEKVAELGNEITRLRTRADELKKQLDDATNRAAATEKAEGTVRELMETAVAWYRKLADPLLELAPDRPEPGFPWQRLTEAQRAAAAATARADKAEARVRQLQTKLDAALNPNARDDRDGAATFHDLIPENWTAATEVRKTTTTIKPPLEAGIPYSLRLLGLPNQVGETPLTSPSDASNRVKVLFGREATDPLAVFSVEQGAMRFKGGGFKNRDAADAAKALRGCILEVTGGGTKRLVCFRATQTMPPLEAPRDPSQPPGDPARERYVGTTNLPPAEFKRDTLVLAAARVVWRLGPDAEPLSVGLRPDAARPGDLVGESDASKFRLTMSPDKQLTLTVEGRPPVAAGNPRLVALEVRARVPGQATPYIVAAQIR